MFNENLKIIRKAKGYTQEELAIKIHVVRQTISKWEKGLSVPDADMLSKLADVLEINVSELLGSEIKEETNKNEVSDNLRRSVNNWRLRIDGVKEYGKLLDLYCWL